MLLLQVVGIKIAYVLVLVGLQGGNLVAIVFEAIELALGILEEGELHSALAEFLFGEHAVFDKDFDVVPFVLEVFAVVLEHLFQLVGYLLADVGGDFLHVAVALEIATRNIQRNVGRVKHTVQQHQVVGHNAFYAVSNEYLIAVELNLVAGGVDSLANFWEIKNTGEVEGVVHVQMYLEQWVFKIHWVELVVEFLIILVGETAGTLAPCRFGVVDDSRLFLFNAFGLFLLTAVTIIHLVKFGLAVHPHALFATADGYGHETAVFAQQLQYFLLFEELLAVVGDMQDDAGAAVGV